jgi:hypothetical protein
MSIKQQARALMMRHHMAQQHRQECAVSRAAAEIGLPSEAVEQWIHSQGKARPAYTVDDANRAAMS